MKLLRLCRPAALGMGLLAVLLGPAHGQTRVDPATEAKAHYELGTTAYGLGHYDRAIEAFTKAHKLDPAPILLYNIAQAYRKKGDRAQAILHYKRYLEAAPTADDRDQVQARIRDLERGADTGGAAAGTAALQAGAAAPAASGDGMSAAPTVLPGASGNEPRLPAGPPVAVPATAPPDLVLAAPGSPPVYRQPWFWGVVGAASLVLVASIIFLRPEGHWTCSAPECNLPTRTVF
jgi:tetratricopeptide (TPR) repeat protein